MAFNKKNTISLVFLFLISFLFFYNISFAQQKIVVGVYEDPPMVFIDEKIPKGFAVELVEYVAKRENIEIEYKHGTWSEMLKWLDSGKIDLVVDILKNESRAEKYYFNKEPIILSWGLVIRNKYSDIENFLDLENKKVGYLKNDYYAIEENGLFNKLEEFNIDTELIGFETYSQMYEKIHEGEIDAGLGNRLGQKEVYKYSNLAFTNLMVAPGGVKIAVKDYNNKYFLTIFDKYVRKLKKEEGSYFNKRYNYWFGNYSTLKFKHYLMQKKEIIFLVILSIFILFITLRYQVYKKSKELKETNEKLENHFGELKIAYKEIDDLLEKYEGLISFLSSDAQSVYLNDKKFLQKMFNSIMQLVDPADYGFIYKIDNEKLDILSLSHKDTCLKGEYYLKDLPNLKDEIVVVENVQNFFKDIVDQKDCKLLNKFNQCIVTRLKNSKDYIGGIVLCINNESDISFSKSDLKIMKAFKNITNSYYINNQMFEKENKFQQEIIFSIVEMLEIHDEYTKGHSENVAKHAKMLAEYIGLSDEKIENIYWASLVHDIGKILIPNRIINKKDRLTKSEYFIMKKHPEYGYRALKRSDETKKISEIVLYHHERIDGKGYPKGIKGKDIPIESKIIAIADAYDAMVSERSYKETMSKKEALEEIERNLNTQFDKKIGEKFIELLKNKGG
ncbi:MAG: HD domain-containing phosphohydrolase [Bacillota bacterium]